eukprot:TRINITY_DN57512_c0_g1_i1.p1 TRINITY_DN57512_c0_g1~~TRINITY_DN57512_c0_g1_i1.p1  ORF type:complete len:122 (+),score=10.82 TRINITY_DN57512_c0_g1_i1:71-436(+)
MAFANGEQIVPLPPKLAWALDGIIPRPMPGDIESVEIHEMSPAQKRLKQAVIVLVSTFAIDLMIVVQVFFGIAGFHLLLSPSSRVDLDISSYRRCGETAAGAPIKEGRFANPPEEINSSKI